MRGIRISFLLLLATLLPSCSIKEDRSVCPCQLTVDASRLLDGTLTPPSWWDKGLRILVMQDEAVLHAPLYRLEEAQEETRFAVPRRPTYVAGILGVEAGVLAWGEIRYPEGCQADPLFVSSAWAACAGEEDRVRLAVNKQYSLVEIWGLESFGQQMEATAGCAALDLRTCRALEGRFRYGLRVDEDGACRFRLPRQSSDDLLILLYGEDGHLDNALPLGRYLTEIGYDWNAVSLSDVSVLVDFVTASVSITVGDWTEMVEFPITL